MRFTAAVLTAATAAVLAAAPAAAATTTPQVVTIADSDGATYKVKLVRQADIDNARALLAHRDDVSHIPNGKIVYGRTDVNTGHKWSIDPADFGWADFTTEVCDGRVVDVDSRTITGGRFCPWQSTVVSVQPAR
jgi:hypothetical protein